MSFLWSRSDSGASSSRKKLADDNVLHYNFDEKERERLQRSLASSSPSVDVSPLPPPATSPNGPTASSKRKKTARIEEGLRVHWARFKKRITTGSEAAQSDAVLEAVESTEASSFSRRRERPCSTAAATDRDEPTVIDDEEDPVDEVVVDRAWYQEAEKTSATQSEVGGSFPEKSGGSHQVTGTDRESLMPKAEGFWGLCLPLAIIRWRLWPAAIDFFSSRFYDPTAEEHYRKEIWFSSKSLALWSSLFFVLNWVLGCALVPKPFALADNIFYFGVAPALTLPVPFFVIFDFARDRPLLYNTFVLLSTWSWSIYQIIFM